MSDYIDVKQFAEVLQIQRTSIFYRVERGLIPAPDHRFGKKMVWEKETVSRFLENQHSDLQQRLEEVVDRNEK